MDGCIAIAYTCMQQSEAAYILLGGIGPIHGILLNSY